MDLRSADTFAGFIRRRGRWESARINVPNSSIVNPNATATEAGPIARPIRRTILTALRNVIVVEPVASAIFISIGAMILVICLPAIPIIPVITAGIAGPWAGIRAAIT